MFALEWCEFCWSVRKLFKEFEIPYRSVDLDSAAYQKDNWGGQIRNVLKARTKSPSRNGTIAFIMYPIIR